MFYVVRYQWLYRDDLTLASEKLEELKGRLEAWKATLESKGLRVNVKKGGHE